MFFSKAIQYQVAPLYLIHRSRVRIMIGNIFLAKADAIAAYEMEPNNSDLVPVLGRVSRIKFWMLPSDLIRAHPIRNLLQLVYFHTIQFQLLTNIKTDFFPLKLTREVVTKIKTIKNCPNWTNLKMKRKQKN